MKRDFALEEVLSLEEYNGLRSKLGKSGLNSRPLSQGRVNRYFIIRDQIIYPDLALLLEDAPDEHQSIRTVWPRDVMGASEARYRTLNEPSDYFAWLTNHEQDFNYLVVSINKGPTRFSNADDFDFRKHNDSWTLDSFYIERHNFRYYTFNGIQPLSQSRNKAAFGLYLPQDADRQLVTPVQFESRPKT